MIKNLFVTGFLLSLSLMFLSCGKAYKTYNDAKYGFSLKYPASWEYEDPKKSGISVSFREPQGKDENRYVSNIVVMAGEAPDDFTARALRDFSVKSMRGYIGNFNLVDEKFIAKDMSANKMDSDLIVYEGVIAGNKIRNTQVFFATGGFAYSVIVSVPLEEYKKYSDLSEKVIRSFAFPKKTK